MAHLPSNRTLRPFVAHAVRAVSSPDVRHHWRRGGLAVSRNRSGTAINCLEYALGLLGKQARTYLEVLVSTAAFPYHSEFTDRIEARSMAKFLLRLRDSRGIEVSDEIRRRAFTCVDFQQLETWIDRAVTATSLAEVFA